MSKFRKPFPNAKELAERWTRLGEQEVVKKIRAIGLQLCAGAVSNIEPTPTVRHHSDGGSIAKYASPSARSSTPL